MPGCQRRLQGRQFKLQYGREFLWLDASLVAHSPGPVRMAQVRIARVLAMVGG
jgi:hypothetical protein